MRRVGVLLLLLAGCGREAAAPEAPAGARLEAAAEAMGLVRDPGQATLVGAWALDTDHACIVRGDDGAARIGVLLDYGDGQGCAARGTAERRGKNGLRVTLGACRIDARFEGDRIVFPAEVPDACAAMCSGRATLAAFEVEQVSQSQSEAATLRTPGGTMLCGS